VVREIGPGAAHVLMPREGAWEYGWEGNERRVVGEERQVYHVALDHC